MRLVLGGYCLLYTSGYLEQIKEKLLEELQTPTAFTIPIGKGIPITESVVVSWIVMGVLILAALLLTSNLKVENPSKLQVGLEEAVKFLNNFADSSIGKHGAVFASYLGTIALYILLSNIIGIFGLVPPTKAVSYTHLDVYKRQIRFLWQSSWSRSLA